MLYATRNQTENEYFPLSEFINAGMKNFHLEEKNPIMELQSYQKYQ